MAERFDRIWHNARLATVREDLPDIGVIERGVIAARGGRIAFAGSHSDFPSRSAELRSFAAKSFQTVENDRENFLPLARGKIQRGQIKFVSRAKTSR